MTALRPSPIRSQPDPVRPLDGGDEGRQGPPLSDEGGGTFYRRRELHRDTAHRPRHEICDLPGSAQIETGCCDPNRLPLAVAPSFLDAAIPAGRSARRKMADKGRK